MFEFFITDFSGSVRVGTCRIFFVPKFDERGQSLQFRDQRAMAIEMDKFTVNCEYTKRAPPLVQELNFSYPIVTPGANDFTRRSDQSSVTIPYERSFRRIGSQFQPTNAEDLAQFQFCGCGWPSHMLVPKGSPEGARFDVFVMISNYADDHVDQDSNLYVANAREFNSTKSLFPIFLFLYKFV